MANSLVSEDAMDWRVGGGGRGESEQLKQLPIETFYEVILIYSWGTEPPAPPLLMLIDEDYLMQPNIKKECLHYARE